MKKLMTLMACFTLTAFALEAVPTVTTAAEEEAPKLICPVAGKPVNMDKSVAYKGAEVYFCCGNCVKAFKENPEKFAVKANHQLVASGQFEQTGCPISGGKLNPETGITLNDVEVTFCCNNCKGKVAGETDEDAQLALVFSDAAFAKGFKKVEKEE
ncbi:YHS domain protein [Polystyrenella longa]|uniref:YHS domain protein n=1 Tax=Polystyrenella longa TaxID=2528007 RepID=A0A518CP01_9PLAN|nr:YHS domain-containing protein [Polystyrenella longa]QDU80956.1 YHS domain protein [Polystyrenella longa]